MSTLLCYNGVELKYLVEFLNVRFERLKKAIKFNYYNYKSSITSTYASEYIFQAALRDAPVCYPHSLLVFLHFNKESLCVEALCGDLINEIPIEISQ